MGMSLKSRNIGENFECWERQDGWGSVSCAGRLQDGPFQVWNLVKNMAWFFQGPLECIQMYIYISLSLACPWTQQSASQSNVASWEIPKGNGGVVRWESHIDFPSRARPCRFAGAQSLCQFYVWSPRFQELESKDWDFDCKWSSNWFPNDWDLPARLLKCESRYLMTDDQWLFLCFAISRRWYWSVFGSMNHIRIMRTTQIPEPVPFYPRVTRVGSPFSSQIDPRGRP